MYFDKDFFFPFSYTVGGDLTILISLLFHPWCISPPRRSPTVMPATRSTSQQSFPAAAMIRNLSAPSPPPPPPPPCNPLPARQLSLWGTPPCWSSLIKMTNTLSNFTIHGAISPRLSHLTSTVTRKRGRQDRYHELLFQMRRLRLRFAQDHAASRWTNGDSHHGFLSQNLLLLTADDAESPLLLTPETTCRVTTSQLCPPSATSIYSSNGWANNGEPPWHPSSRQQDCPRDSEAMRGSWWPG